MTEYFILTSGGILISGSLIGGPLVDLVMDIKEL